jgi:hypothetical protein
MESSLHHKSHHDLLIEISKHVLYEIRQFEDKSRRLALFAGKADAEEYIVHSVFESFLVHSRVVYEFLFQSRSHRTDVRAGDFQEDIGYELPDPDEYLKDWARYMTDKRLMHLTTDRLEMVGNKHEWEINRIYSPLHGQLLQFYAWVPCGHICIDLNRLKESELLATRSAFEGKPGDEFNSVPWGSNLIVDTSGPKLMVTIR